MKPRNSSPFRSPASLAAAFSVAWLIQFTAPTASAAGGPFYWDNNGTTAGFGTPAAGTWTVPTTGSVTQGWSTSSTGILLPATITTDNTDTLNFGTATTGNGLGAGTITVSGTVAAGNLTYGSQSGNIVLTCTPCYPNCDGSTTVPILNVNDFSCFLNAFAAGNTYANCDNSTTAPVLNVNDFSCFLNAFAAGCS